MILHPPIAISSRLLPSITIADCTISIDYDGTSPDGRDRYVVFFDFADGTTHEDRNLKSGCQGGSLQDGLSSLLSFLGAAAESYAYQRRTGRPGENVELFPAPIVEWADQHSDDLSMLACELDESDEPLIEE